MTRLITTTPADTSRAMHAAEMRGQDMQDAPERIRIADVKPPGEIWRKGFDEKITGHFSHRYVEYTRTDLCITEAECQRRIDAAVAAERDVWLSALNRSLDLETALHIGMDTNIIRARGQK